MEVTGAADIAVLDRRPVRGRFRPGAMEVVLQDRMDRRIGSGADGQGPFAGCFQGLRAVRLGQAHDAKAGTEALFGMTAVAQDDLDQRRRVGPDLRGPSLQPLGRPFGMAPVTGRHVIWKGRVLAIAGGSDMGGNALTLMEYLDRPCGEPDPDLLAQQAVRSRIVVFGDLDVVVESHSALLPFRKNVCLGGQGLQGGAFNLIKDIAAAGIKMPGHAIIQPIEEDADRRVQFGQ